MMLIAICFERTKSFAQRLFANWSSKKWTNLRPRTLTNPTKWWKNIVLSGWDKICKRSICPKVAFCLWKLLFDRKPMIWMKCTGEKWRQGEPFNKQKTVLCYKIRQKNLFEQFCSLWFATRKLHSSAILWHRC